jgi:hypothetical protein
MPVNLVAVGYGVAMMVNIAWPRAEVYDPAGSSWVLQYSAVLFVAGLAVVGFVVHRVLRRRRGAPAVPAAVPEGTPVAEVAVAEG